MKNIFIKKNPAINPPSRSLWALNIFLLALLLRCLYLVFLKKHYLFYDAPGDDVLYYQAWAEQIANGDWKGSGVFYGMPLYAYFLAMIKRLCLGVPVFIRIAHLILGSLNCVLIFTIAQKLFSRNTAILAGLLGASNFLLIYYDWLMTPVTLLISLTLIIILAFLQTTPSTKKREWLLLGFLTGAACLGDGKFLIFFIVLGAYLAWESRETFTFDLRRVILPLTIGFLVVLAAVGIRNRIIGGDWIMISAQSGLSFYVGNNPQSSGLYENPDFIRPTHEGQDQDQQIYAMAEEQRTLTPSEISGFWRNQAFQFILSEPLQYLNLLFTKFRLFFTQHELANDIDLILQRDYQRDWDFNPLFMVFPLAGLGIFLSRKNSGTRILNIAILSQLIFTMVFFLNTRHRAGILPLLIIYESAALIWIFEKFRRREYLMIGVPVIVVSLYLFAFRPVAIDPAIFSFLKASKSGPALERQGELDKAEGQYQLALRVRPNDTTTLYNIANLFSKRKNYSQAIFYYKKALSQAPQHVDALFNLGYAYEQWGKTDMAMARYGQVLNLAPNSMDAHFRMAQILQSKGDCTHAVRHYAVILDLHPDLTNFIASQISSCSGFSAYQP